MSAFEVLVHGVGLLQALRIDVQNRFELRPLLVVGLDAVQVLLHQIMAGQRTRLQRAVNIHNGSLHQMKGAIRARAGNRHQQKSKQESGYS